MRRNFIAAIDALEAERLGVRRPPRRVRGAVITGALVASLAAVAVVLWLWMRPPEWIARAFGKASQRDGDRVTGGQGSAVPPPTGVDRSSPRQPPRR
jgi:hypothetical protein